jgi:hypothetical protein
MRASFKRTIATVLITGLSAVLLWLVSGSFDSSGWQGATCLPNCFNEAIRPGAILQPVSTFSSLAYAFVGIYVLLAREGFDNKIWRHVFAWSLIITGFGSAFFHMTLSFVGQTVDVVGMYLLATFVIVYAFRSAKISAKQLAALYAAFNVLLLVVLIFAPGLRRYLFALLLVAGLVLEYFRNRKLCSQKLLGAAAGVLLFGFGIWTVDQLRLLSADWFYGHTAWHIFGAVAGYLLYKYYAQKTVAPHPARRG